MSVPTDTHSDSTLSSPNISNPVLLPYTLHMVQHDVAPAYLPSSALSHLPSLLFDPGPPASCQFLGNTLLQQRAHALLLPVTLFVWYRSLPLGLFSNLTFAVNTIRFLPPTSGKGVPTTFSFLSIHPVSIIRLSV